MSLSKDKNVYIFGSLDSKLKWKVVELELHDKPFKIKSSEKFVAIASNINYCVAATLSSRGLCYIWGDIGGDIIRKPQMTTFTSLNDLFKNYFEITFGVIDIFEKTEIEKTEQSLSSQESESSGDNKLRLYSNIGKYSNEFLLLNEIGSGSFGKVFKVKYLFDEHFYAIKVIEYAGA